ncbi:MAG: hypothetical protein MJ160_00250 [Treponema sp.]|nr:hypothetical protein [Treponema sp.]
MLLFLVFLIPLLLTLYYFFSEKRNFILVTTIGLVTSILVCLVRLFVFYSHRLIIDSFIQNYFFYLVRLAIIPIGLLYGVFFLLTRDTVEYKLKAFFPLVASFFAVYLPYYIISASGPSYSGYDCFLRPALYAAMIVQLSYSINNLYKFVVEKDQKGIIISSVIAAVYLLFPAAVDSSYMIGRGFGFAVILSIMFIAYPAFISVLKFLKKDE